MTCFSRLAKLLGLTLVAALAARGACAAEYGVLKYSDGKSFQTGVFEPKHVDELPTKNKAPYLVFSGRSCHECDANRTLYIHSPVDGPMLGSGRDRRYTYPGRYHDFETDQLVQTVRVFLGQCLTSGQHVVLWLENAKSESDKWKKGAFVAEVIDDRLVARPLNDPPPDMQQVTAAVKARKCRELRGGKGYTEP